LVVLTSQGCRWAIDATSSANGWVQLETTGGWSGSGAVSYTVQANMSTDGRTAEIAVKGDAGQVLGVHRVTQRAATCLYGVTPTDTTLDWMGTYDGAGDSPFRVFVSVQASDCSWTATPTVPWMRVVYGSASGTGAREIYVSVANWNTASTPRVGDIVVSGLSGVNPVARLVVTQGGR
jgi:hypothetical protein